MKCSECVYYVGNPGFQTFYTCGLLEEELEFAYDPKVDYTGATYYKKNTYYYLIMDECKKLMTKFERFFSSLIDLEGMVYRGYLNKNEHCKLASRVRKRNLPENNNKSIVKRVSKKQKEDDLKSLLEIRGDLDAKS